MRATARVQGRFVSTCGLKKIIGAPGSRYQLVIVDHTGCPVSHLMEWYRLRQKQPGTDSTRRTYLNFLLPFMGYILKKGAKWNGEPEYIRVQVQTFLREEVACLVARDQDADGYRVQLTGNSPLAQSSLQVFFAALRDFYLIMHDAGLYAYENPMRQKCSEAGNENGCDALRMLALLIVLVFVVSPGRTPGSSLPLFSVSNASSPGSLVLHRNQHWPSAE